jgi:hypothetical protein
VQDVTKVILKAFLHKKVPKTQQRYILQLHYDPSAAKNFQYYSQMCKSYPPDVLKDTFRGSFMLFPMFIMNRSLYKELILQNIFGIERMMHFDSIIDRDTKGFDIYYNMHINVNEKILDWVLKSCINLKTLMVRNDPKPENGKRFLYQTLEAGEYPYPLLKIEKLRIYDQNNPEIYNNLLEKVKHSLKHLIHIGEDTDTYIDLLNAKMIESLEIRNISEHSAELIKSMQNLTRLAVIEVIKPEEITLLNGLLPQLKLKEFKIRLDIGIKEEETDSLCQAL